MRLTRWLTLALFGFVSLLGHGLHLLDCRCTNHSHVAHEAAEADAAVTDDGRSGHCPHCAGCDRHATEPSSENGQRGIAQAGGHDDDCLICRFFAQGQLAAWEAPHLCGPLAVTHRPALPVDAPFVSAPEPYQARGPPVVF